MLYNISMENKHLEIKTIEHKGVRITLELDYEAGTASLVEFLSKGQYGFLKTQPKKFVFAGRTLDYMNGWLLILQAMNKAVEECKKCLEADLAQKSSFRNKVIEDISLQGVVNKKVKQKK